MMPPIFSYAFLILFSFSAASGLSRNESSLVHRREATIPCIAYCDTISCGSQTCPLQRRGSLPTSARAASPGPGQRTGFYLMNSTLNSVLHASTESQSSPLGKRIFKIRVGDTGGRIPRSPRYLVDDVKNYLADNLGVGGGGNWDTQYERRGFFDHDMKTVTQDRQFGAIPFEFGTNSLHGCTMLTIVSRRAVWMAHFWEGYAFKDSYNLDAPEIEVDGKMVRDDGGPDNGANLQSWQDRAVAALTGQPTSTPLHMPTFGNPIDPTLFNQPGDNTEAIFMSPAWSIVTDSRGKVIADYKYFNKLGELEMAIRRLIPGVKMDREAYIPLNYYIPAHEAQIDRNDRGMALFQYDPDADGAGGKYYRLFYESHVRIRNLS